MQSTGISKYVQYTRYCRGAASSDLQDTIFVHKKQVCIKQAIYKKNYGTHWLICCYEDLIFFNKDKKLKNAKN